MKNKPKVLYKYTTAEVGLKILETRTIRFSNPKTFNDPYDCNMPIIFKNLKKLDNEFFINLNKRIREYLNLDQETITKLDNELENLKNINIEICADDYLNIILEPLKQDMRILSLSKIKNNLLMWGHYAKNHTGVAIEFDTNYKFFRHLIKINYDNEIPKLKDSLIKDLCLSNATAFEELRRFFHTKSTHWKYEQEYRFELSLKHLYKEFLSSPNSIVSSSQFFEEIKNKNDFVHPYIVPNCINALYLGKNINIIDENKIIELMNKSYPHVKIFKAFLSKKEFKINFVEIEK